MSPSRERALLAALAADPEDDATRAVLADLLVRRGDPRGEVMQILLAPGDLTPDQHAALEALEARHWRAWTAPFRKRSPLLSFQMDRGFVAEVEGPPRALVKHAAAIAKLGPFVRTVTAALAPADRDLTALAASALCARTCNLTITATGAVRPTGWSAVAALRTLRALEIDGVLLGPRELADIFAGHYTDLHLRNNRYAPRSTAAFAALPTHLRDLDLHGIRLDPGAGPELGRHIGARCRLLRRLSLGSVGLGDAGFAALAPALATVEVLVVSGNRISGSARAVLASIGPQLRALDVADNATRGAAATDDVVALLPRWPALETLTLDAPSPAGIAALAAMPSLASLKLLVIGGRRPTREVAAALLGSPHLATARVVVGDRHLARAPATRRGSP